ncbi:hypothetical protein ACVDG3_02290 [Meridianimarinicoccus sp. RP-17]|uniref:hypothetical protein n=1 Tax=Meridianimarinicoccus zhengii TaxID=2056810 RepID=UPI000DAE6271|nr:hypothetical protein [Phycocomes zhengii]
MRIWLLAIWMAISAAAAAQGSAWPRSPGSGFIAAGFEAVTTRDALGPDGIEQDPSPDFTGYRTLYAEIGVTPRLTFGIDFGADDPGGGKWVGGQMASQMGYPSADSPQDIYDWPQISGWTGVAFARVAVGPLDARHRFALSLGVGARRYEKPGLYYGLEERVEEPVLRAGAAWGAGFDGPFLPGWASLAASVDWRQDSGGVVRKLDATLGFKPEGRWTYILQVQGGDYPDAPTYAKLAPGVVTRLIGGLSLETGLIWGFHGTDEVGLRTALWFEW